MKKHLYILISLFSLVPIMATQNVTKSLIVASTLVLSNTSSKRSFDKSLSLDLHKAVEQKDYSSVQKLITNPKVDVNAKVDYYYDVKKTARINGITPLIYCSWQGDALLKVAQALVEHRYIKVNVQDEGGRAPLMHACIEGDKSLKIAKLLLEHRDINVNIQDNDGCTPLMRCCIHPDKSLGIAKWLFRHPHTNVNIQDKDGNAPLIECCIQGDESMLVIAKLLFEHPFTDVNIEDKHGHRPLIECCINGDKSLVIARALLGHKGIEIDVKDKDDNTPLDHIIYQIKANKKNYTYVKLWGVMVAKSVMLGKCVTDYNNLNSNDFEEPQKTYVRLIKQNPPKGCDDTKLINSKEEETKEKE